MPAKITIYNVDGTEKECWGPTARETVREYPDVWSRQPWPAVTPEPKAAASKGDAGTAGAEPGGAAAAQPPAPPAPSAEKIDIPENWEELTFFKKQDLAQKILGVNDPGIKKDQAEKIISEYLAAQ